MLRRQTFLIVLYVICSIVTCGTSLAAGEPDRAPGPDPSVATAIVPMVTNVRAVGGEDNDHMIAIGDTVAVSVTALEKWRPILTAQPKVIPFLNGIGIAKVYPIAIDTSRGIITFRLQRTEANKEDWAALLRNPDVFHPTLENVVFSVGTEDGAVLPIAPSVPAATTQQSSSGASSMPTPTGSAVVTLVVLRQGWAIAFAAVLVAALIAMLYSAIKGDLLRDTDQRIPDNAPNGTRLPYSLARSQMAFWFFIVITSFIGMFLIVNSVELPLSALALLGISTATTVGAAVVDTNKASQRTDKANHVRDARSALTAANAQLLASPNDPLRQAALAKAQGDLLQRQQELDSSFVPFQPSEGFLHDVLSDSEGLNIHRFQAAIWTLVLGVIFLWTVYTTLAMPDFSATLLGLMGISSGAYLLLKIPEKT
jgi:hypothetical protein